MRLAFKTDPKTGQPHKLFSTQLEDLRLIAQNARYANFSEMGAGKTWPHAILAKGVIDDNLCDHSLIVVPKAVLDDWRDVYTDVIDCDYKNLVTVYYAPAKVRPFIKLRPIIITTYEYFVADLERFTELAANKRIMLVIDEAHKARTTTTARFKALDQVSQLALRVYPLTGTPLPNGLKNAYAYIQLLAPGVYYRDYHQFKKRHMRYSPYDKRVLIGYRDEARITGILGDMSVRHRMDDVCDLPPVINKEVHVDWDDAQLKAYEELAEAGILELENKFIEAHNPLALLTRLHQILNHPEMLGLPCKSLKWKQIHEDLEAIGLSEHKVVIWAHYRDTIDRLAIELAEHNPAKLYGGTADFEGQKRKFREDPTCRVMIGNPQSVGIGTNFTVANYMIFFEYTYDLDEYDQAISRCRRPGQQHKLYVRNYAVRGSMESRKILPRLIEKKAFSAKILQDVDALKDFIKLEHEQIKTIEW